MKKIYFFCTGNSCRSQMAEGFSKKYFPKDWEIKSAGIETHGLNPKAVQAMAEVGINISQQQSELIDVAYLNDCNLVVTLCGDTRDKCPMTPDSVQRIHWPLADPAQATGSDAEVFQQFRTTRDEIQKRIESLSENLR